MKTWIACVFLLVAVLRIPASDLKSDESLVLFPTLAQHHDEDGGYWTASVHGWVFELDPRRILVPVFRRALGFKSDEMTGEERSIFIDRARHFLTDNERGDAIAIRLGDITVRMHKSAPNGQFLGEIRVSDAEMASLLKTNASPAGQLPITAVLPPKDPRVIGGWVQVLPAEGLSVISDIDDTIKISQVTNRHELLRNTFMRPFQAVPGMAAFYERLATNAHAQFHYVSASPWQLYPSLADFISTNGFPSGSFHLKTFRWKDESFFSLFESPEKYKLAVIEPMLKQFPQRHFILIGDSGEKDPETYGELARRHPGQIEHIYIRSLTGETAEASRYQKAFKEVPASVWRVFEKPEELLKER